MSVKIIAEIGANHNGELSLAKEMAQAAKESGADYAKYQSWQSHKIPPGPWDHEGPFFQYNTKRDFYNASELSNQDHHDLIKYCDSIGIKFLTTCFDRERNEFLSTLGLDTIKVASCDLASTKMISELSDNFGRIILSTGMGTFEEIEASRNLLIKEAKDFAMLYCVAEYPTNLSSVSLSRMLKIRDMMPTQDNFGISDHSLGTSMAKVAVVHGAKWIEKHFTIDNDIPGPDNKMSMLPSQMSEIRAFCDDFENMSSGDRLEPTDAEKELKNIIVGRFGNNA
jgi:sialic acid synthase SpsE